MLSDPKSAQVRGVAKLNKKDARSETGLFLLEGPQGLKEVLAEPETVVDLFATIEATERHVELFDAVAAAGLAVQLVTERVIQVMSDTTSPQGILAVCRQIDVHLDAVIANRPKLIALLANIRDPGNAGTVLRAADAAGADAVIFSSGSVDLYNPKLIRSTTGSIFHLQVVTGVEIGAAIEKLKDAGLQVFAADGGGQLITELSEPELAAPTAWVFGNEAWGLEPETLAAVTRVVGLPLYGQAESLNLATAAGVCLYESAFAQNA